MRTIPRILILCILLPASAFSNPYFDPRKIAIDAPYTASFETLSSMSQADISANAVDVLRIQVSWNETDENYSVASAVIEKSGTSALVARAAREDKLGSYQATLGDPATGEILSYASIGTGKEFRTLVRELSFRFPVPPKTVEFRLMAENPKTGKMEEVQRYRIDPKALKITPFSLAGLEVKQLKAANASPVLMINIYADGYTADRQDAFWKAAQKTVDALKNIHFPQFDHIEFTGVFAPSNLKLGKAQNLGLPVPERDSFLGLYYPYWHNFGRWYNVVYPTRETKYRDGIGKVPYDYPIVLIDSQEYWGIGNFNELTAVPSESPRFTYLLLHEFGHFFGLNEEYEGGGPTELAFAPEIEEPWSQNITFLKDANLLKWKLFVDSTTPIPTPKATWTGKGPLGAYLGGYADSEPVHKSHKPGFACIMSSGQKYCDVCSDAISKKIQFDLGI